MTVNLATLSRSARRLWVDGYRWGYQAGEQAGYKRGYTTCDDEIAALQRHAVRVVHANAGLTPHTEHVLAWRQHMVEAAARHAANARPWPDEENT